jgi:hypothetical protein
MNQMGKISNDDAYSTEEAAKRRDEVIRRMANTPPQPKAISPRHQGKKKKVGAGHATDRSRVVRGR